MTDQEESDEGRRGRLFNRFASLTAVVFSLAAILISILEVTAIQAQQHAAVWPYIQISQSYSGDGFALEIENKGLGPALVGDVTVLYRGAVQDDLDDLVEAVVGQERAFSYNVYLSSNPARGVVAAGETVNFFRVPWTDDTRAFVEGAAGAVDIKTCYCSIYDQCWQASLMEQTPQPTPRCD